MANEQTTPDEDEQDKQDEQDTANDTPFLDFHSLDSALAVAMRREAAIIDYRRVYAENERLRAEYTAMRSLLASLVMEAPDDTRAIGALQERARVLLGH